jgi:hypothetical protein
MFYHWLSAYYWSEADCVAAFPTTPSPTGNAFGPAGFWADRFEQTTEQMPRKRDSIDSLLETCPREPNEGDGDESHKVVTKPTLITVSSEHKGVYLDVDCNKPFITWKSMEDRPFHIDESLDAMGRQNNSQKEKKHPFPSFEMPQEPFLQEAYEHIRGMLIGYWHGRPIAYPKEQPAEGNFDPAASSDSLEIISPGPPKPPKLKSKQSRWRILSRSKSDQSDQGNEPTDREDVGRSHSLANTPRLSKPLIIKKQKKESRWTPPAMGGTSQRALDISRTILRQMQVDFEALYYPGFKQYVSTRPFNIATEIADFDEREKDAVKEHSFSTWVDLQYPEDWIKLTDPEAWANPRNLSDPSKYKFSTILDLQRQSIEMTQRQSRGEVFSIPSCAMRLIWATRFVEWAVENHKKAVKEYEELKERSMELIKESAASSPIKSSANSQSNSDDDLTYPKLLMDIEKKAYDSETGLPNFDSDVPSPVSPTSKDESPEEAKKRRRGTAFNMGLVYSDNPPREAEVIAQKVNTYEKERTSWEKELQQGLEAERQRQKLENERRASGKRMS